MMRLIQAFHEGGWFMYVVVLVALLASGVAMLAAGAAFVQSTRQPALGISLAAVALAIAVPVTGGIGYALAMRNVYGALALVDSASRAQLLSQGMAEAINLVVFGGVCAAPPLLLGAIATVRAATRPAR